MGEEENSITTGIAIMGGGGLQVGVKAAVFAYASHVLAALAAALVLLWCIHFRGGLAFSSANKPLIFNVHPVLMVIGFIIMGGEAIMSFRTLPGSKRARKVVHLMLHGAAVVLGAFGISAAFKFHNEVGIDNLYSLHSWLGLATICLYGLQWAIGFVAFFYPGVSVERKQTSLPWHALLGLLIFALAIASSQIGFSEKLTFLQFTGLPRRSGEAFLVNFTALVVLLFGASVVISAVLPPSSHSKVDAAAI